MLNIYLGDKEDTIFHPPTYFDNTYEDEWITDPLSIATIVQNGSCKLLLKKIWQSI